METNIYCVLMKKSLGVLLHISSLPNDFPIGDFGPAAYALVDRLAGLQIEYWQILPLGPADPEYFYSPYTVFSAFALSELYVSPELLREQGLLAAEDMTVCPAAQTDYARAGALKNALLRQAYAHFKPDEDYMRFQREQAFWLRSYAEFQALRRAAGRPWPQWQSAAPDAGLVEYEIFVQYVLFDQWRRLKKYANGKGVKIIGDLPIFAAHHSADVWRWPQYFKLRPDKSMAVVAGVPPDYFNQLGQVWNLPLYDWPVLQREDFGWWRERVRHALQKYDLIRLDHFRGLEACYEIPGGDTDGLRGQWVRTPGRALLAALQQDFPALPLLAEDLGVITPAVRSLRDDFGLSGMRVGLLDFIDYPRLRGDSEHNIKQVPENCVLYSTTHDFNTVRGWYASAEPEAQAYFRRETGSTEPAAYLRYWAAAPARLVIFPAQDILGLGAAARMNTPGTSGAGRNWTWRLENLDGLAMACPAARN
ncbi:MAG: 4-alpha-glucanotransferase [Candidatus Margulisbacteria bacterium]|jgi:4-alpha-glucanotransferase|nr:4-alpha-glucanotransferase [Candidatus Margulisiibacteriota bacterium]